MPIEEGVASAPESLSSPTMNDRVMAHDWAATSIGLPATWPRALQTAIGIAISSRQPMFVAWGQELTFIYNDAYASILGNKHPAALGLPFERVWSEIWNDIKPLVNHALSGESTWSENLPLTLERNGYCEDTWWTFSYSPVRDDEGRIGGMFCSCMETTTQVLAERRSTAERERLFEMSRDLFGVATFDGYLKTINPAWSRLLERSDEELLARPFAEIIHPDDLAATAEVVAALSSGEAVHQFHVRLLKSNGEPIAFAWSAVPERVHADGTFYTVGRDISEDLRREEMLRQAQKMEAVGQLTGGLAHDFNNLLTGMMGNLELLQMRVSQGRLADSDRFITAAQGAGRRAASLTQRLLAFSRRQTLDPKPVDINRLIAGMEDLIHRTIGPEITLEVVGAAGLWPALIDAGQLENALLNLCINARDAMPDGGRLTIETANKWLDDRSGRERDLPAGQYLSLCVTDTGTGMSPETVARAFDPFFTTKPLGEGTGLGLSMIYGFARQSNGQVRIYSEVAHGTTMCIYLPRYIGDADESSVEAVETHTEGVAGTTVLVVDDEPTVRNLINEVLHEQGYAVIDAVDGPTGLKVLESDARIDLLITDVGLPNGMNGRQVADAARALRTGLPVLFITGYAENAAVGNGHMEPGMELLTKPFSMTDLTRRVRMMLEA